MAVPSDYAGLELWLKGDAGTYQDDAATTPATATGHVIAVWQDQSGNARHLTQTVNGNRPTLDATGVGGKAVVNLAAASRQFWNVPNFLTGLTTGEIYVVLKRAADPPAGGSPNGGFWRLGSHASDNDHYPWTDSIVYMGAGTTVRKTVGNPTPSLALWHTLRILTASADYRVWGGAEDDLLYSIATNTVGWTTAPTFGKSIGDYHWDGKVAEVFIYSQARSDAERTALLAYITSRYFNPLHRESQVFAEIAHDPGGQKLRDSEIFLEVAHDIDNKLRDSSTFLEVAYVPAPASALGTRIAAMIGS